MISNQVDKNSEPEKVQDDFEKGDRGNWLKKLGWIKQAREYQAQIIESHSKIIEIRKNNYSEKLEKVNLKLDQFHFDAKVKREDLNSILENIESELEKKIKDLIIKLKSIKVEDKNETEKINIYEIEEKVSAKKEDVEQVKFDLESLYEIDQTFNQRVIVLDEYISQATEILEEAEQIVESTFEILDHDIVREKAYRVKFLLKKIQEIENYTTGDALNLFESEFKTLNEETEKIETKIKKIKETLQNLDLELERHSMEISKESKPENKKKQPLRKKSESIKRGFFSSIFYFILNLFYLPFSLIKNFFLIFF